jgi:hypothetical protein
MLCVLETGDTEMTKTQFISTRIATLVAEGHTVREAIDAVLGAGAYDKLASDVWEAAQK